MRLKILKKGRYTIAAVMDGEVCPAEAFITTGEASHQASRVGFGKPAGKACLRRIRQFNQQHDP